MPAGDPVKAPASNVGYSRFGPYHKNRTARVTDDPIGDPAGENPPYPSAAPAPHGDQADPELLGERDELLGRAFLS